MSEETVKNETQETEGVPVEAGASASTPKEKSKTDLFKAEIQTIVSDAFGKKVSKEAAWDLFKKLQKAPFDFVLAMPFDPSTMEVVYKDIKDAEGNPTGQKEEAGIKFAIDEQRLPLAGVGTFEVIKTRARGKAAESGQSWVPRPRFYPSSTVEQDINVHFGFAEPKPEKVAKAEIEADQKAPAPAKDFAIDIDDM